MGLGCTLLILALLVPGNSGQDEDISALLKELRSDQAEAREKAAAALLEIGPRAVPALEAALAGRDPDLASRSKGLLVRIANRQHLTPRFRASFRTAEDSLAVGGANAWTRLLVASQGFEGNLLRHPTLRREDLEGLAPAALRGAQNLEERRVVHAILRERRLLSAIPALLEATRSGDSADRFEAIRTLDALRVSEAVQAALALDADPEPSIRSEALQILGASCDRTHLARVRRALTEESDFIMHSAASAVAILLPDEQIPELLASLKSGEAALRVGALAVLGRLGKVATVSAVIPLLKDPEARVRREALQALQGVRAREASAEVAILLKDPQAAVRQKAIETLGSLGDEAWVGSILESLDGAAAPIRESAALALGWMGSPKAIPRLLALLDDDAASVRGAALRALVRLKAKEILPRLRADLAGTDETRRVNAAAALADLDDRESISGIAELLTSTFPGSRESALEALAELQARPALARITACLEDPGSGVRLEAIRALQALGDPGSAVPLRAGLRDASHDVRIAAAEALCSLISSEGLPVLLDEGSDWLALNSLASAESVRAVRVCILEAGTAGTPVEVLSRGMEKAGSILTWPQAPPWAERGHFRVTAERRQQSFGVLLARILGPAWVPVVEGGRWSIRSRDAAREYWTRWKAEEKEKR